MLQQCKLLVWDECTMSHKRAIEALDRTIKDIKGNRHIMGGMVVLLAGNFRQTLPVINKGTPADEINACLKASVLWADEEQRSARAAVAGARRLPPMLNYRLVSTHFLKQP
ncbi:ATP-dependent DNA helicase PIF7 [Eumeta japonica]|uniref:ATP-dependent DNA helicase n=1 Tax=Eumeta variegata TaxID=151549 RepID=A0A4C1ZTM3_EUMVA|nr:ATP-dependent DNA helicase PIF7 [Eumeta japonica]